MALTKTPIELSSTPGIVDNSNTTAITIDASENVLVGKTSNTFSTPGFVANANGIGATRSGGACVQINRTSSDGTIQEFYKDGSAVGSIGTYSGDLTIGNGSTVGLIFEQTGSDRISPWNLTTNATRDGEIDLGDSDQRWKDGYFSGDVNATNFTGVGDGDTFIGMSGSNIMRFSTGNVESFRIDSSGRLLVNTTSILTGSSAKLQVLQTVTGQWSQRVNNSTASPYGLAIDYTSASPNGTANQFHYCTDTGGARWGVYSNGGVLNYSGNNVNLSDRNAKKDITLHTDDEWNCVKAWEIVDYRYNDEADDSPTKIGVIAQQIQEHCPDLVNVFQEQADAVEEVLGEDGEVVTEAKAAVEERIGVNEAQMMWKVTKALQEAMTRIETLEAKVQTLENN